MKKTGISKTDAENRIGTGKGIIPKLGSLGELNAADIEIEKDFPGAKISLMRI